MLFSKPLQELSFQDIVDFCDIWPEGVRVEYKASLNTDRIPKVVSSLANTVGGIWIIGAKTDKSTNRVLPPIEGIKREPGLEERITQSCYQNLYPALLPDVQIIDVPANPNKVMVVVRVIESPEAPHAIENSTRVYIRSNTTTEIISLAEIDRIDFLLKRRREAETRGDSLSNKMSQRGIVAPAFQFLIGPQYPYKPVFSQEMLFNRVSSLSQFPRICKYCHPVRQGVMSPSRLLRGAPTADMYFEVNVYGQMTYQQRTELVETGALRYLTFEHLVSFLHKGVELSRSVLGGSLLNLRVRAGVDGISDTGLISNQTVTDSYCLDNSVEAEALMMSDRLTDKDLGLELMVDLVTQMLWPYNWGGDREVIKSEIRRALPRR
jgi:hypothetical protein